MDITDLRADGLDELQKSLFLKSIDGIAEAIRNSSPLWEQLLTDTLTVTLGAFAGAMFAFWFSMRLHDKQEKANNEKEKAKEEAYQTSEIDYAMLSFASNAETLLLFKRNFIIKNNQDIEKIQAAKKEGLSSVITVLPTLQEMFKLYPKQIFWEIDATQRLRFMSNKRPKYLHTFHKTKEHIKKINGMIEQRNSFILNYMEHDHSQNGVHAAQIYNAIDMLSSYADGLAVTVDASLYFIDVASENLISYAKEYYKGHILAKFELIESYKYLMPPKDYIKGYREVLQKSIDESVVSPSFPPSQ